MFVWRIIISYENYRVLCVTRFFYSACPSRLKSLFLFRLTFSTSSDSNACNNTYPNANKGDTATRIYIAYLCTYVLFLESFGFVCCLKKFCFANIHFMYYFGRINWIEWIKIKGGERESKWNKR